MVFEMSHIILSGPSKFGQIPPQLKIGKAGDIGILATDSWSTAFPNAFQDERDIKLMFFIPLSFKRFVCRMIADSWVGFYCYDIISL